MFKCNNQTQFNQRTQNCDWWYNVDCGGRSGSLSDFETAASSTTTTTTTSTTTAASATPAPPSTTLAPTESEVGAQSSSQPEAAALSGGQSGDRGISPDDSATGAPVDESSASSTSLSEPRVGASLDDAAGSPLPATTDSAQQPTTSESSFPTELNNNATKEEMSVEPEVGTFSASGDSLRQAKGGSSDAPTTTTTTTASATTSATTASNQRRRLIQSEFGLGVQQQQQRSVSSRGGHLYASNHRYGQQVERNSQPQVSPALNSSEASSGESSYPDASDALNDDATASEVAPLFAGSRIGAIAPMTTPATTATSTAITVARSARDQASVVVGERAPPIQRTVPSGTSQPMASAAAHLASDQVSSTAATVTSGRAARFGARLAKDAARTATAEAA